MDHERYDDAYLRGILRGVKTIAMVGASPNWNRPSYFAMTYLQGKGYKVIPINPGVAGQAILKETVFARLADVPQPVDMTLKSPARTTGAPVASSSAARVPSRSNQRSLKSNFGPGAGLPFGRYRQPTSIPATAASM